MASKKKGQKADSDLKPTDLEQLAVELIDTTKIELMVKDIKARNQELKRDVEQYQEAIKNINSSELQQTLQISAETQLNLENKIARTLTLEQQKIQFQQYIKDLTNENDLKIKNMSNDFEQQLIDKQDEIDKLRDLIVLYNGFPLRQIQYDDQKKLLIQQINESKVNHLEEIQKVTKAYQKQRKTEENIHNQKIQKIMQQARSEAEKQSKQDDQRIRKQNEILDQELKLNYEEKLHLTQQVDEIQQENQIFENFFDQKDQIEKFEKNCYSQTVKIKRSTEKIAFLKQFIIEEIDKYKKQSEIQKEQHIKQLNDIQQKIKNTSDQIYSKQKEFKNLKGMMQMILDQRSDLEEWFLESYYKLQQNEPSIKKPNLSSNRSLPVLKNVDQSKSNNQIFDEQNRLKLLNMLFEKINQKIVPQSWRLAKDKSKQTI